ncbi:hypothetical protein MASR1M107_12860 [Ignavibacteriales bacterium]
MNNEVRTELVEEQVTTSEMEDVKSESEVVQTEKTTEDNVTKTESTDEMFEKLKTELMDEIRKYFEPLLKNEVVESLPSTLSENSEYDDDESESEQPEDSLIAKLLQETRW